MAPVSLPCARLCARAARGRRRSDVVIVVLLALRQQQLVLREQQQQRRPHLVPHHDLLRLRLRLRRRPPLAGLGLRRHRRGRHRSSAVCVRAVPIRLRGYVPFPLSSSAFVCCVPKAALHVITDRLPVLLSWLPFLAGHDPPFSAPQNTLLKYHAAPPHVPPQVLLYGRRHQNAGRRPGSWKHGCAYIKLACSPIPLLAKAHLDHSTQSSLSSAIPPLSKHRGPICFLVFKAGFARVRVARTVPNDLAPCQLISH